ncbi:hypothetical protein JOB18_032362 [Solea senegalensis]|uniref:Uncharacterized protein n=1 Tax=Solea senegalensis TaxID=28829 RepID=A0AAV6S9D5_SOLSE|nr:hypothetical protein JOB18_032362 [Solea senegalensis]
MNKFFNHINCVVFINDRYCQIIKVGADFLLQNSCRNLICISLIQISFLEMVEDFADATVRVTLPMDCDRVVVERLV